ncbi:hypothetical protein K7432_016203 [Basidiobolus ranarum]|uniref:BZIP domain-containing protein n=1 Tax=Basidiobolus ranarum TaxID=34480 RepID=A0ABR2VLY1_9FUNG
MLSPIEQFEDMSDTSKYGYHDFSSEDSPASPEEHCSSPPADQPPQKKKPGRKPNPASPALRKAQNRAAQRAFRERKERHLKELEVCVKELRDNQHKAHSELERENQKLRYLIQILKNDNVHLRSIVSSFNSSMAEKPLSGVMQPANKSLSSPMFTPSSNVSNINSALVTPIPLSRSCLTASYQRDPLSYSSFSNEADIDSGFYESTYLSGMEYSTPCTSMESESCVLENNEKMYYAASEKPVSTDVEDNLQQAILEGSFLTVFPDGVTLTIPPPDFGHINGGVAMNLIPEIREPKYMFKEYDSRIDRVPSEKLKELMIEQQGNYDLDELWELFTTKAVCHGDPRDPSAWELPDEFYSRFPMLVDPALKTRERMRTAWWRLNGRIKMGDKVRSYSF